MSYMQPTCMCVALRPLATDPCSRSCAGSRDCCCRMPYAKSCQEKRAKVLSDRRVGDEKSRARGARVRWREERSASSKKSDEGRSTLSNSPRLTRAFEEVSIGRYREAFPHAWS